MGNYGDSGDSPEEESAAHGERSVARLALRRGNLACHFITPCGDEDWN
jgi:hypothetical protein